MTADLHDVRDELRYIQNKCSRGTYTSKFSKCNTKYKSCESRNCSKLKGKLKRAFEEIDGLTKQKDDLSMALSEAKKAPKCEDLDNHEMDIIKVDF
ncbi:unnamed protein product [Onchocerca ochengi]|uniref:Tubulin-specific chaperone A n=1 Tax=Onchocerca ochengi TaxID=42157 RepID=A0A182EKX4_ONCOC|nr:unnamed protein product [Onchocerca ochengi]